MGDPDVIVLDSDDDARPAKRQRTFSSDDEVQVIERPDKPVHAPDGPEAALAEGDDLLMTRFVGEVNFSVITVAKAASFAQYVNEC